jgi:hypothetical protein
MYIYIIDNPVDNNVINVVEAEENQLKQIGNGSLLIYEDKDYYIENANTGDKCIFLNADDYYTTKRINWNFREYIDLIKHKTPC